MPDIARWIVALSTLIGLGLALGLNPALYGATADMLARNKQVPARMTWMIVGLFTGATILYLLLQSFNPTGLVTLVERSADAAVLSRRVDLIAGGVFLVAAVAVVWWRLRVPLRPARAAGSVKARTRSVGYFWLGLSCSVIGFTTLPIMYTTGRVAAGLSPEPLPRLLAYGVFLVGLAAPFVLLAGVWSRFPTAGASVSRVYDRVLHVDFRWAYAAILALAGFVCIGFGVLAGR